VADQTQQLNWIVAAFNLTAAAFLPAWSQMADIFGRHGTLQAAILILGIGSAICTGAPTSAFGVLLLGRALQGLGAAGINIIGHTIMADRASLEDYAWNWTLAAIISAIFFSIGPIIGGHLVQVNWRWCFAINLPVLAAAIVAVVIILSKEVIGPQPLSGVDDRTVSSRRSRTLKRLMVLDYGGQAFFLSGLVLLILALTWAGGAYPWGSVRVILPLILGAALVVAWVIYEYSMAPHHTMSRVFPLQQAMMPWNVLSQKDIGLLFWINFSEGMASFAVMYFMDIYFTLVLGHSPSEAGENLLFYLPGLGGKHCWFTPESMPSLLIRHRQWAPFWLNFRPIPGLDKRSHHCLQVLQRQLWALLFSCQQSMQEILR
jgi:MFS family permease